MATRSRLIGPLLKSREQAQETAAEVADLMLDRQKQAARMEGKLNKIREEFAADLDALDKGIERGTLAVKDWAENNPEEFGDKRSIEFAHTTVGFLTHPPHITPTPQARKATAAVVEAVQAQGGRFAKLFLAVKITINKDACLAAFKQATPDADVLNDIGIDTAQREQFYIKPRREQLDVDASKAETQQPA